MYTNDTGRGGKSGEEIGDWKVEGNVTKGGLERNDHAGLCKTNNFHVTYGLYDYQKYYCISMSQKLGLKAETSEQWPSK